MFLTYELLEQASYKLDIVPMQNTNKYLPTYSTVKINMENNGVFYVYFD